MSHDDVPVLIEDLKAQPHFLENLRFDVTPETICAPRFLTPDNKAQAYAETHGFMFYVDALGGSRPLLMLMKTKELRSATVGFIEGAPEELLAAAVGREGVRDYCGMYPIDDAIEKWLKERLGV